MQGRPLSNGTANRRAQAIVNRLHRENPTATEFESNVTEDWLCVDCGINTAPGFSDGATALREIEEKGGFGVTIGPDSEVYMVRGAIWAKAGMEPFGGCLCIGCLERRLGRKLKPKDFSEHPFNGMPGSERLLRRRKYWYVAAQAR